MNIIGQVVKHNIYGEGTIINFEERENYSGKIVVVFDDNGVEISKEFLLVALCNEKFFDKDALSKEMLQFVEEYEENYKKTDNTAELAAKVARARGAKRLYLKDEYDEVITLETLQKMYSLAGVEREEYESRAVVADETDLYVTASAACRANEIRVKDCNKIYRVCDNKAKSYYGRRWRYATKAEIQRYIDTYEELSKNELDTKDLQ